VRNLNRLSRNHNAAVFTAASLMLGLAGEYIPPAQAAQNQAKTELGEQAKNPFDRDMATGLAGILKELKELKARTSPTTIRGQKYTRFFYNQKNLNKLTGGYYTVEADVPKDQKTPTRLVVNAGNLSKGESSRTILQTGPNSSYYEQIFATKNGQHRARQFLIDQDKFYTATDNFHFSLADPVKVRTAIISVVDLARDDLIKAAESEMKQ
jgi:hypothetical protein